MQADDVVRMANQIAHFFAPYPEADAVEGVRDHLEKFWTPAMRRELRAILEGGASEAATPATATLHPLVMLAVDGMRTGAQR
jgi:formate dehydrogenase subunit delta